MGRGRRRASVRVRLKASEGSLRGDAASPPSSCQWRLGRLTLLPWDPKHQAGHFDRTTTARLPRLLRPLAGSHWLPLSALEEGAGITALSCEAIRSGICSSSSDCLTNGCRRCQSFLSPSVGKFREKKRQHFAARGCDKRSVLIGQRLAWPILGRNGGSPYPLPSWRWVRPRGGREGTWRLVRRLRSR